VTVIISSASQAFSIIAKGGIDACVSISSPKGSPYHKRPINLHSVPVVHEFTIDDLNDNPSKHAPDEDFISDLLLVLSQHGKAFFQEEPTLLIHCFAGQSRSTAAAVIGFADAFGPGFEQEAFDKAKACSNNPDLFFPNHKLLALADKVMNRGGALASLA
jgi:predicted protein tyrosine phosphatase